MSASWNERPPFGTDLRHLFDRSSPGTGRRSQPTPPARVKAHVIVSASGKPDSAAGSPLLARLLTDWPVLPLLTLGCHRSTSAFGMRDWYATPRFAG
jgi:hypothetical protein